MSGARWTPIALLLYAVASLSAMAPMSIGAGLVMLALLVDARGIRGLREAFSREARLPASRAYMRLSLLLFSACAFSLVVAHFRPLEVGGRVADADFARNLKKAWYLAWPFLLAVAFRSCSPTERARVLGAWFAAAAGFALLGIQQVFTGFPHVQYVPNFRNTIHHATAFLGHHLSVASVFLFPFFAALDGATSRTPPFRRGFLAIVAASCALVLVASFSRAVWMALPLALTVFLFLRLRGKARWGLLAALVLALAGLSRTDLVYERMTQVDGKSTRYELWEAHLHLFRERPLTGAGWKLGQEYSGYYLEAKHPEAQGVFSGHAHNNLLEMLGGTGILGATAWLFWCGFVFRELFRERRRAGDGGSAVFATGLLAAWIAFHVNGLTQVNFWEAKSLHQVSFAVGLLLFWRGEGRGA